MLSRPPNHAQKIIQKRLDEVKSHIGLPTAAGPAKEWWDNLENLNRDQIHLVLRLAKELELRKVTVSDFFDVWRYSHLEDVESNLSRLDQLLQDRGYPETTQISSGS